MNLPNKLTICRILMIPLMIACFYLPRDVVPYWNIIAAVIFILAYLTDILDGYLARKNNLVSNFGKLMDPIADKLLTASALIMLRGEGLMGELEGVAVIVVIAREFIISGIRLVAAADGTVIAASKLGKLKTVTQAVAI
ncbi:MAG: CDP-diacylglycerol--glycerol-3-phosphate 3-phosphatidyltransferase, partial [Clostridia bacterium]|nr:CDP-diacylglycerol--glycerol-3-phosphate 3-phosphatidyltransferase [Clostridia bacterium]